VRVDSRGAGRSPGHLDIFSARETRDYYLCIEWAGTAPWSTGKVGLLGVSYYGMNQWQVAALRPPHLVAICPWEGASDYYREFTHHGGILNIFTSRWYPVQVSSVQHGVGERGLRDIVTGEPVAGPETLPDHELAANRSDPVADLLAHPLDDDYYAERSPRLEDIEVPVLSAANWAHHLHTRGNFEAFGRVSSARRWLEVHGFEHYAEFYTDYGVGLQKRFFGHFLKGDDTGWESQPKVLLQVRHPGERFVERHENEWPLARTEWRKYFLDAGDLTLSDAPTQQEGSVTYAGFGDGVTFLTPPLPSETELTGPLAAKLFVSSATEDADLFLVVRVFGPDLKEVVFHGALDPHTPVAQGWLRASHRKLDKELSLPYRPYHTHDEIQPLDPGEVYELDVEIWPTCIVVPPGHRIALTVRGRDYVYPGDISDTGEKLGGVWNGVGPFKHDDPRDRPAEIFGGDVTVHTGPDRQSHLLLPVIPER
jgi:hypothetical protein